MDTKELMKQVGRLRVLTNRLVDQQLTGAYHAVFKGQGIEFDEVREYAFGDDVRSIDWNVTARMGHPYIKRFSEERELTVIFLVDISGSQCFGSGTRSKAETAAELTCLLALSAIKNQDNIGLILFSDRIEKCIPPRKGRTAAMRLVREVLAAEETPHGTDIAGALRFLTSVQKRRAVVFLISDFLDNNYDKALRVASRKHDLICCPIRDPREVELPDVGLIEIENAETGELMLVDTRSASLRAHFAQQASAEQETLNRLFTRNKMDRLDLSTAQPVIDEVRRLFRRRQVRSKNG
ncbi:MAG TPA: DUF58 domain-containing protein [Verrucomicrobia bacterium]|nr:DUF58 domain-containing protein [Verrucomicrobiota bacterium]